MRRGDFAAAWRESDAWLRAGGARPAPERPRHLQTIWDGRPPAGRRVLVRCYHGLGDTIQFIRYVPLLRRVAAEVTVWAQPPLLPLLARLRGGAGRRVYFKCPSAAPGLRPEHDLFVQHLKLTNTLRVLAGEDPLHHTGRDDHCDEPFARPGRR